MNQKEAVPVVSKTCSRCSQSKPLTAFWRRAASADGLQLMCKACQKSCAHQMREHRKDWPEHVGPLECSTCKQFKVAQDFPKRLGTLHGKQYECTKCSQQRMQHRYHKEKQVFAKATALQHKRCCACQQEKSALEFYSHAGHKDRLQSHCIACMTARYISKATRSAIAT